MRAYALAEDVRQHAVVTEESRKIQFRQTAQILR
jgi:hypothetical protein